MTHDEHLKLIAAKYLEKYTQEVHQKSQKIFNKQRIYETTILAIIYLSLVIPAGMIWGLKTQWIIMLSILTHTICEHIIVPFLSNIYLRCKLLRVYKKIEKQFFNKLENYHE